MPFAFEVTWDYLCPFARNAHEHIVTALRAGADWDVRFRFFSLSQAHLEDGTVVWDQPAGRSGVMAGLAGVVAREKYPDKWLDAHIALFSARHDEGLDLRRPEVIAGALDQAGLDGREVLEQAAEPWARQLARSEHETAVRDLDVFGVPTFIAGGRAAFVRLMDRPEGDGKRAEATIERVLELFQNFPELNEYKLTRLPR